MKYPATSALRTDIAVGGVLKLLTATGARM